MDTEAMIEGMVQGYQQKITQLGQDRTMLQWQQSAYQSISDKLVEFSRKYMSYNSPATNLFSASFFNNAILTSANGTYADLVSATGKSSSTIVLNSVAQLAEAARYTHDASGLGTVGKGQPVKLDEKQPLSAMSGSLTLEYGNKEVTLDFGELELFNKADGTLDTAKFQTALQDKLKEQKITTSSGDQVSADTLIDVKVDSNGTVTLSDKKGAGNNVHFSGATGDLKNLVTSAGAEGTSSFTLSPTETVVKEGTSKAEHLFGKSFTVTLNGQTKTFTLGDPKTDAVPQNNEDIKKLLEKELDNAFGKDKINVTLVPDADGKESFSFSVSNGDTFRITSPVGEVLGLGENGVTSYVDTGKTLGDLLGKDLGGSDGWAKGVGQPHEVKDADGNISYVDNEGNAVDKDNYRLDKDGKRFKELTINGVTIGQYNEDTALETVLNDINSNTEAGVSVSFSKTTNQFVFTAKETGEGGRIDIGAGLGETLFGQIDYKDDGSTILGDTQKSSYTAGKDAIFHATINGKNMALSRSSNTFDLDGMSITLNGTFNKGSATDTPILSSQLKGLDPDKDTTIFDLNGDDVTFSSKTDTDKIIDVVKTMVEDYNAIVSEVKKAYSDMPLEKSDGSRYKPLTDEDKADMTESEIKAYEEKAKTGILFMDRDLSSLYSALRSAVAPGGSDGSFLRSIGIKTSYEDGLTTLSLDENALREALEQNPDQVKDAFTKSKENGAASDGLMASIQKVTDRYAATTGATKGILIEKAGSKYSPSAALNNTLLEQMKDIDKQVDKWQAKMSDKVDYYTNKFTQLEMLIAQMNSQSSSLAGMMGGY
ncbi:flagellar filament capping protein FliD [Flavonifractor plautii]|nr:flagellar filament capping protein FliD [Flavonifractor plautii]MSB09359.1 flagellar filament capping protein FliD [Flavonifractor plautii]MSB22795.1 flagellar filament capping protein FliD [Flavonifractor plautii]MSB50787.1 flagellar filament capping protein FliD [Flavonifractor plautii]MSB87401.1 flagellar filament capping protein FliD [Flavonifractor plautii]